MAENAKRSREKYSKLICLECRRRRIRCGLPDPSIDASQEPQPPDKACNRCTNNGIACIVDYTTLGRPARKRSCIANATKLSNSSAVASASSGGSSIDGGAHIGVEDFLLSRPEIGSDKLRPRQSRPTRSETIEANSSPFALLSNLLARDPDFASALGAQPKPDGHILDFVSEHVVEILNEHLFWYRLYYPDIPQLEHLRRDVSQLERGQTTHTPSLFLFTLLCDLALDVPSAVLEPYRDLQEHASKCLHDSAQQLFFSCSRTPETVLGLTLAAQYRPLAFASSQATAPLALRAVSIQLLSMQIARELEYDAAAARLTDVLAGSDDGKVAIESLVQQCIYWLRLSTAHDSSSNADSEKVFLSTAPNQSAAASASALGMAFALGRMPADVLLPYTLACGAYEMVVTLSMLAENWKDLDVLEEKIHAHKEYCEKQTAALERTLIAQQLSIDQVNAIMQLHQASSNMYHNAVKGCALFFAVMYGAHATSNQRHIRRDQAMELSNDIISQLTSQESDTREPPRHLMFLETHGKSRLDELEMDLADFITSASNLRHNDGPYVGPIRHCTVMMLSTAKTIVEEQAARLKGWGGLHERVDVQMILFQECARRLEGMSATAGTQEAFAKGCILTATARLIRSLHTILQSFKDTVVARQRNPASASTSSSAQPTVTPEGSLASQDVTSIGAVVCPIRADGFTADMFAEWQNWPHIDQFDPNEFSDLFPGLAE